MSANAETSDRLIGATVTVVLHALLFVVFLLLVVSVEIPDKPEGDGNTLEVSYGMDALGSGTEDKDPASAVAQSAAEPESNPDDQLLASEVSDAAITVKKPVDKPKTKTVNKETKKTENKTQQQVDADLTGLKDLIGGGGDGDDGVAGNVGGGGTEPGRGRGKGKGGSGGTGNSPRLVTTHKQRHATYDCQEEGIQKVKVKINRRGDVVTASGNQAGSTNVAACLKEKAEKLAKEESYNDDPAGAEFRYYTTSFDFFLQ